MTISKGFGACVGWGVESTYGTAVTPTLWEELVSSGLVEKQSGIGQPTLRSRSVRQFAPSKLETSGSIEVLGNYEGAAFLGLIKAALGSASSATVVDTTYTHTIVMADSLPALTFEIKPDGGDLAKNMQYSGCKINKMSLSCEVDGPLKGVFDILGDGRRTIISANTTTYPTHVGAQWDDLAATLGGTATKIYGWTLEVDNGLEVHYALGQRYATANEPKSERKVSGSIKCAMDGETIINLFKNQTETNGVFTFTGPLAGSTTPYSISFRVPRLVFNSDNQAPKDGGVQFLELPFDAFYDVTNTLGEIVVTAVNKTTTI
jgi:hypothetical protein